MRYRHIPPKPGHRYPLEDSYHYPLPRGLTAGDVVTACEFDSGYWTVEKDGQHYSVFMTLVCAGMEYEIGDLWFPKSDPRVQARLVTPRLR